MFGLLGCIGFDLMSGIMRRVLGCVCCIACAGPILFIVGIVLIVAPNDRKENVDKYNSAIKTYQSGDMVAIKASNGFAGQTSTTANTALSLSNSPVDVSGSTDGVDSSNSWTLQASQVTTSVLGSNRNVVVRIRHGTGAYSTITTSTPLTRTESKSLSCSAFGSHSTGSCSSTALRNRCEDDYDGHGSVSCRKSSGRYKCSMSCAYSSYLTKVCVPVAYNSVSKKWSKSMEFDSCTAPFAARDQTYGASTSQTDIAVTVMSEEDPNIQLEKIAGADRSFGLSAAQQRGLGAALLGVGIAMTVFVYGGIALAIYCFVRSRRGNDNDQNQYQPQPATTGYAQPGQAGYCEPAGYPAQQPQPYAQAPPPQPQSYGAPPPQPYGAPPVPQQQQPYGAPPPQPYGAPPQQQPQPYGAPPQHYAAM